MSKKTLTLTILSIVFVLISLVYTICPVIPFARYKPYTKDGWQTTFDYTSRYEKDALYKETCSSFMIYFPNGKFTSYHTFKAYYKQGESPKFRVAIVDKGYYRRFGEELDMRSKPTTESEKYYTSVTHCEVSCLKKRVTYPSGSYVETKFNPTFIFYLLSAGSISALIYFYKKDKKDKEEENE